MGKEADRLLLRMAERISIKRGAAYSLHTLTGTESYLGQNFHLTCPVLFFLRIIIYEYIWQGSLKGFDPNNAPGVSDSSCYVDKVPKYLFGPCSMFLRLEDKRAFWLDDKQAFWAINYMTILLLIKTQSLIPL